MSATSILWRRIDVPGHDACRLESRDGGWSLAGSAVFLHAGAPARLDYEVLCDGDWNTRRGEVRGWLGARSIERRVERTSGGVWTLDGVVTAGVEDCSDLDLGFTPATNTISLLRLGLAVGQAAEVPVAWLSDDIAALERLAQHYERRSETEYAYRSPSSRYAAVLEVTPAGFVRRYPGLWEAEAET